MREADSERDGGSDPGPAETSRAVSSRSGAGGRRRRQGAPPGARDSHGPRSEGGHGASREQIEGEWESPCQRQTRRTLRGEPGPGRAGPSGHDARGRVCTHTQPHTRGSEPAGLERGPGKAVKAAGGFTQ